MTRLNSLVIIVAATVSTLAACGSSDRAAQVSKPVMTQKSLYERLGKMPAIQAVVDETVKNIAADASINARFANTDMAMLKQRLSDQICEASGGPCKYTGKNMVEAHAGMKISDAEFDALVGDLKKALDKFKVPDREQQDLLGALGGMRGDIVNR